MIERDEGTVWYPKAQFGSIAGLMILTPEIPDPLAKTAGSIGVASASKTADAK